MIDDSCCTILSDPLDPEKAKMAKTPEDDFYRRISAFDCLSMCLSCLGASNTGKTPYCLQQCESRNRKTLRFAISIGECLSSGLNIKARKTALKMLKN